MFIQHIKNHLQAWFDFPENKIFCQVSTTNNGCPRVRTMDLYDVTSEGALILITHTRSRKWDDLQKSSRIAICMLNPDCGQIVVEGHAILKSITNDLALTTLYWNSYLNDYWRNFYLAQEPNTRKNTGKIPSSFGIIVVVPDVWEILEINQDDFLKGSRKRLQLQDTLWVKDELPLL